MYFVRIRCRHDIDGADQPLQQPDSSRTKIRKRPIYLHLVFFRFLSIQNRSKILNKPLFQYIAVTGCIYKYSNIM